MLAQWHGGWQVQRLGACTCQWGSCLRRRMPGIAAALLDAALTWLLYPSLCRRRASCWRTSLQTPRASAWTPAASERLWTHVRHASVLAASINHHWCRLNDIVLAASRCQMAASDVTNRVEVEDRVLCDVRYRYEMPGFRSGDAAVS